MAICSICNARKGKRKCLKGGMVCSQCCGETRAPETCTGCSFYSGGACTRNYRSVPYYETSQLADSLELQGPAHTIESILCAFDARGYVEFTDKTAQRLIELLLDIHHFKDPDPVVEDEALAAMFAEMRRTLANDLADVAEEELVKSLAAVYRSIQRRRNGARAYLDFIRQYVGIRIGPGARVLSLFE